MDNRNFLEKIAFLSKYLRYVLTEEYAKLYWEMLKHLSDEQLNLACTNIVKDFVPSTKVPFPLVVHFLRYCGEAGDNLAIASVGRLKQAIRRVGQYESVTFNDPALHWTVNSFGGWESVCLWSDNDWNINEKRLLETYKAAINNRFAEESHLQGISEKSNGFYRIYSVTQTGKVLSGPLKEPGKVEFKKQQSIDSKLNVSHISEYVEKFKQS